MGKLTELVGITLHMKNLVAGNLEVKCVLFTCSFFILGTVFKAPTHL